MATIRDRYVLNVDTGPAVKSINNVRAALGAVGGALAVGSIVQATRGITNAVTAYERLQTVLTTYLGSQQRANRELERLQNLALGLPQDLQDISEAFVIFTRTGLSTTNEALTNFSNIATASGRSLSQLAEAVADATTGEFERLKEFGIRVRREGETLTAFMGDQQVAISNSATDLVRQLERLGATRFADAAEANANTLSQSMSNLRGTIWQSVVAFGQGLVPALKDANDSLAEMLRNNRELITEMGVNLGQALYQVGEGIAFLIENIDTLSVALSTIIAFKIASVFAQMARTIVNLGVQVSKGTASFKTFTATLGRIAAAIPGVTYLARAITLLLGPIGWAVTAVTGLYLLFQNFKDETVQLGNTTSTWGELTRAVLSRVGDAFRSVFDFFGAGLRKTKDDLDSLSTIFTNLLQSIATITATAINRMIGMWRLMFEVITAGILFIPRLFGDALTATLGIVREGALRIGQQFTNLWDIITSRGEVEFQNMFSGFGDVIGAEISAINTSNDIDWDGILNTDYIGVVQNKLGGIGESLVLSYRDANTAAGEQREIVSQIAIQAALTLEAARSKAQQQAAITQAVETERAAQQGIVETIREGAEQTLARYNQQTALITLSEREREVMQLRYSIEESAMQQIAALKERQTQLTGENTEAARAQIAVIQETIQAIQAQAAAEIPAIQEAVRLRMEANAQLERTQELEQLRLNVQQEVASANERIAQSQNEINRASLEGLEGIERKLKEIELEEREIASAARRRIEAQNENLDASSIKEALREIEASTNAAIEQRQAAAQATEARLEQIRREQNTFANGWKKAYKQYAEDANNASKAAERAFNTTTKTMEDSIVEFAKTGKFEWRDFLDTIVEELLRSQVRQLIAQTFGAFSGAPGGQSGAGGLASMFGESSGIPTSGAQGGLASILGGLGGIGQGQAGQSQVGSVIDSIGSAVGSVFGGSGGGGISSIVKGISNTVGSVFGGSGGGGISSIVKGISNTVGSVFGGSSKKSTPSKKSSPFGGITDTISSVKSIFDKGKSLFGGFFATGGQIPAGRFGMVGENGPEFVRGPANIEPMANTNVTYNINAVDARSFKELVARDPAFIHAVAQQGASNVPVRR